MNFSVENIDVFSCNKNANFVMSNAGVRIHRRFDFAQRPVVPIIRFRLLSGAEISGAEISDVFITKPILLINTILFKIKIFIV